MAIRSPRSASRPASVSLPDARDSESRPASGKTRSSSRPSSRNDEDTSRYRRLAIRARGGALRERISCAARAPSRGPSRVAAGRAAGRRTSASSAGTCAPARSIAIMVGARGEALAGSRLQDGEARPARYSRSSRDGAGRRGRLRPGRDRRQGPQRRAVSRRRQCRPCRAGTRTGERARRARARAGTGEGGRHGAASLSCAVRDRRLAVERTGCAGVLPPFRRSRAATYRDGRGRDAGACGARRNGSRAACGAPETDRERRGRLGAAAEAVARASRRSSASASGARPTGCSHHRGSETQRSAHDRAWIARFVGTLGAAPRQRGVAIKPSARGARPRPHKWPRSGCFRCARSRTAAACEP